MQWYTVKYTKPQPLGEDASTWWCTPDTWMGLQHWISEHTFSSLKVLNLKVRIAGMHAVTQLCLTLCHTLECSPPGSSVHGIFQARILEWVAMLSSRGFSRPTQGLNLCLLCQGAESLPLSHWGNLLYVGDLLYYVHLTAEEIGSETLRNLPKVT